jgi:hypothetical protein
VIGVLRTATLNVPDKLRLKIDCLAVRFNLRILRRQVLLLVAISLVGVLARKRLVDVLMRDHHDLVDAKLLLALHTADLFHIDGSRRLLFC